MADPSQRWHSRRHTPNQCLPRRDVRGPVESTDLMWVAAFLWYLVSWICCQNGYCECQCWHAWFSPRPETAKSYDASRHVHSVGFVSPSSIIFNAKRNSILAVDLSFIVKSQWLIFTSNHIPLWSWLQRRSLAKRLPWRCPEARPRSTVVASAVLSATNLGKL